MGIHRERLNKPCRFCGQNVMRVSMKSPHIDDYLEECSNPACRDYGHAAEKLYSMARSAARVEEAQIGRQREDEAETTDNY